MGSSRGRHSIQQCRFVDSTLASIVGNGGAVHISGFGVTNVTDSVFMNNHGRANGGAVYVHPSVRTRVGPVPRTSQSILLRVDTGTCATRGCTYITSEKECALNATSLGWLKLIRDNVINDKFKPTGCFGQRNFLGNYTTFFNTHNSSLHCSKQFSCVCLCLGASRSSSGLSLIHI